VKLLKPLQASLQRFADAGSSWTVAMDEASHQAALKLEKLRLVKLVPRYTAARVRGGCRGRLNGYDVIVTSAGKDQLS